MRERDETKWSRVIIKKTKEKKAVSVHWSDSLYSSGGRVVRASLEA